jgi:hypothetical protein
VTEREELCLEYLDKLMESDAFSIGRYVRANMLNPAHGGSNLPAIGAAVVGKLRKQGLVTFLPDLKAWRITREGRAALYAARSLS